MCETVKTPLLLGFIILSEFSLTYLISLETLEAWLHFEIKICWFEQYLAAQQGFVITKPAARHKN